MDLYMSNIYSRISLRAIEFYSQICEQTRNLRQLTLTQVQKNTQILGYILTGDQENRIYTHLLRFRCTKNKKIRRG